MPICLHAGLMLKNRWSLQRLHSFLLNPENGTAFNLIGLRIKPKTGFVPTISTFSLVNHNNFDVTICGNVTNQGSSDLTSYGFVWNTTGSPTLSDNVVEIGTGSFTGEFCTDIGSLPNTVCSFAAYATNSVGTAYGLTRTVYPGPCFIAGTAIKTINGDKNIEDVDYNDILLVWNFDEAKFDKAKPVWISKHHKRSQYRLVEFSDGTKLGIVPGPQVGHRIFNIQKNKFTYLCTDETPIGTMTYNDQGETIYVVGSELIDKEVTFHNVITNRHINVFANTILTSSGLNNIYPIVNLQYVKEDRQLRSKNEFDNISDELFCGLRLSEQPESYPDLKNKINNMILKQLS